MPRPAFPADPKKSIAFNSTNRATFTAAEKQPCRGRRARMQHQRRRDELVRQVAELEMKQGVGTARSWSGRATSWRSRVAAAGPRERVRAARLAAGPGLPAADWPPVPPPSGPAIRRFDRLAPWVSSRRLSTRGRRRVAVRQSGEPVSPKGAPPSACCTRRRAFIQRNFTVGTATPSSAAASACGIP